jgi:PKD repeat protein
MQRTITLLALASVSVFFAIRSHSSSNGPGGGYTGAPSEGDCTSCHAGTLRTAGAKWGRIRLIDNFTGNGYIPDSTYTLAVSYRESGRSKFGFQITCLNSSNAPAGTFTATSTRAQRVTRTINSLTREYIEQSSSGTSGVTSDSTIWFFSWKAPSTNQGNLTFYVALNATNSNSQNSGDSIYTKRFTVGPSSLLPTAKAGADASSTCTNYQFQFRGTGSGSPTSWSWSFPTGNPASSTAQNPLVSYSSSGNKLAILTVRNSKGVSRPDTFRFSVSQSPVVSILGPNSISLCQGDSAQLTCSQTGAVRYFWPALNASTRTVTVKDSNDYRVVLTNTITGCSAVSAPVRVRVLPRPVVAITATPDSVCSGEPFSLSATPAALDSYYFYRNGKLETKGKSASYNTTAIQGEVLGVQVRAANGCFSSAQANAKLYVQNPLPKPAPFLVQRSTDAVTIGWQQVQGNLGYQTSVDSGKTWSASFADTAATFRNLNPDSRYRLRVRAISSAPCSASDSSIEVRTLPCSGLRFEVRYDSLLCSGDTGQIRIAGLKGSRYSLSLNGSAYNRDTLFRVAPDRNTDYLLRVKDSTALACPDILRSLPVKVSQPIALVLSPSPAADKLCAGDTLNLQIPAGFDAAVLYVNKQSGISFNNSIRIPGLKTGDSLYVLGENGACSAKSPVLSITTLPLPDARFTIQTGNPHVFAPLDTAHTGYNWNFGDGNTSSARNAFHAFAASETGKTLQVKLRVTGKNGCAGETVQSYQVPDVSAVLPAFWRSLQVYPVPAGNELNVVFPSAASFDVTLLDARGATVKQFTGRGKLLISTSEMPAGQYLMRMESAGQSITVPVVVTH